MGPLGVGAPGSMCGPVARGEQQLVPAPSSRAGGRQCAQGPQWQPPPACQRRARLQHAQPGPGAAASPQPGTRAPGAAAARAGLSRALCRGTGTQPARAAATSHGAGCQRLPGSEEQRRTRGDFQGREHLARALLLATHLQGRRAGRCRQQLVGPNPRAPAPARAEVTPPALGTDSAPRGQCRGRAGEAMEAQGCRQ